MISKLLTNQYGAYSVSKLDLAEIRRRNALYLDRKFGRQKLAEKLGYQDENYLNGLLRGHSSFGNKTARKFEAKLTLDDFWMDRVHPAEWGAADDPEVYEAMISGLSSDQILELIDTCLKKIAAR